MIRNHQAGEFQCDECHLCFQSEKAKDRHVKKEHSKEKANNPNDQIQGEGEADNVPDDQCQGEGSLHRRKKTREKLKCSLCSYSNLHPSRIKRHMSFHARKPRLKRLQWQCERCGKHFRSRRGWTYHRTKHCKQLPVTINPVSEDKILEVCDELDCANVIKSSIVMGIKQLIGKRALPFNVRKNLKLSLNKAERFYEVKQVQVEYKDEVINSALVHVKDFDQFCSAVSKGRGVDSPKWVMGLDCGQNKLISEYKIFTKYLTSIIVKPKELSVCQKNCPSIFLDIVYESLKLVSIVCSLFSVLNLIR